MVVNDLDLGIRLALRFIELFRLEGEIGPLTRAHEYAQRYQWNGGKEKLSGLFLKNKLESSSSSKRKTTFLKKKGKEIQCFLIC